MSINNNNLNPTDNFSRQGKVLQQVFNTNGSVFLDQHHNHHENNDKNLTYPGNHNETPQEPLRGSNEENNLFDFFFLNQDNDDYSTQETYKDDVKDTTEGSTKGNTENGDTYHQSDSKFAAKKIVATDKNYTIPASLKKTFRIPYASKPPTAINSTPLQKNTASKVLHISLPTVTPNNTEKVLNAPTTHFNTNPSSTAEPAGIQTGTLNASNNLNNGKDPSATVSTKITEDVNTINMPPSSASTLPENTHDTITTKLITKTLNITPTHKNNSLLGTRSFFCNDQPQAPDLIIKPTTTNRDLPTNLFITNNEGFSSPKGSILKTHQSNTTTNTNMKTNLNPFLQMNHESELKPIPTTDTYLPPDLESLQHIITLQPKVLTPPFN